MICCQWFLKKSFIEFSFWSTSKIFKLTSFLLNSKLLITSECCCNNDVAVILDAYSRKFEANISKSEINFNNICQNIHESFRCKKNVEFTGSSLSAISDMWCEVKTENVRFDNNSMLVNGIVTAYIIALDNENVPIFYEKSIECCFGYCGGHKCFCKCINKFSWWICFSGQNIHNGISTFCSQLTNKKFVKHPLEVVSVGDVVEVKVMSVDVKKQRIQLTMRNI